MTTNLQRLHRDCHAPVLSVYTSRGRLRDDAFFVHGLFVRLVGWLRFVWSAAFGGGFGGVLVLRGDDGIKCAPRVLLDWESYSTLLLLAKPDALPAMTDCGNGHDEMGGSFE